MWFLLIQIIFFMVLAAGLGAAAAWWWLRRRFVDVTEAHAELTRQVETALADGRALTREDVHAELQSALNTYRPPEPDLSAILRRLDGLDAALSAPDAQLEGLAGRMGLLEQSLSGVTPSLTAVSDASTQELSGRIDALLETVRNIPQPDMSPLITLLEANTPPDTAPIFARLDEIEARIGAIIIPEIDLGPVHSSLARMDLSLSEIELPDVDLGLVTTRLSEIEAGLSGDIAALRASVDEIDLPAPADLTPIYNRLAELDISLTDRIAQIETRLTATAPINEALIATLAGMEADLNVVAARRPTDIEPVYGQLAALDADLGALRGDLRALPRADMIERRLSALQESLAAAAAAPQPDISRADLTALEDRLTAIEYGLTALHHMLRARSEPARSEAINGSTHPRPSPPAAPRSHPVPADPALRARRAEAIAAARKPDDEANLLTHAAFGEGDELSRIIGVGPILTELLHEVGVFYFWQIAEWTDEEIAYVDGKLLHFRGRIERDDWVGQARELAAEPGAARRPGNA